MNQRVYAVEDDADIRETVVYALRAARYDAEGFEDGAAFFRRLETAAPDIVLLDVMLPGEDGLSILRRLKADAAWRGIPVIILSAKGSEVDKVKGLDMGADDYVAKPFGVMELISRVNAALRRATAAAQDDGAALTRGGIVLDQGRHTVTAGGADVQLTHKEYELLRFLMLNAGLALSREKLMERVWGFDFEGESRTVDVHVKTLRRKLGAAGAAIETVRNVGYRLN